MEEIAGTTMMLEMMITIVMRSQSASLMTIARNDQHRDLMLLRWGWFLSRQ